MKYEKSELEIAYNEATKSEFNQDMRNVYTNEDAIKFIPFFRMSEDISHLDDNKIIYVILEMAKLHRDLYVMENNENIRKIRDKAINSPN